MLRLTRWTIAHRRIVAIGWVAVAVGVLAISSSVGTRTANNFSLPNTGSQHATDLLASRFPAQAGDADQIVFHARSGKLSDPAIQSTVSASIARVSKLPHVTAAVSPYANGSKAISPTGTIGFATVTFDKRANQLPKAAIQRVITNAEAARSPALQVELGGQAIQQAQSTGVGIAAALGVVLVLAASLTLLPALLRLLGRRIGEAGRARAAGPSDKPGFWARWVTSIQRRPALAAVAATAVMLALAAPALGLRLGASDAGNDPAGQTTRKAYDLIAQGYGKGFNGPLQVAVKLPKANAPAALAHLNAGLRATLDVASVAAPRLNPAGDTASIQVFPRSSPQSAQTTSLVTHLRTSVLPPLERATGTTVYVGGATASQADFAHVLSSKLPLFIGIVIALSALLLLVVFRSLMIPLQAAVMNLLSIGAALGIVQAIFERGWLFGLQPGPIDAFIPVMGFAIIFGLSMDYEVFLISRVHEEWQARGDATAAIREGLAHTGRVITAAALVMVAVFGSFAFSGSRPLQLLGVMMATAVFLDAFVIRMLLLPAVLQLLGRRTWAFPRGLDRRLPRVAIEPHTAPRRGYPPVPALEEGA